MLRRRLAAIALSLCAGSLTVEAGPRERGRSRAAAADRDRHDRGGEAPGSVASQTVSLEELVAVAVRQSPALASASARRRLRHAIAAREGAIDEWRVTAIAGTDRRNAEREPDQPYTLTRDDRLRGALELARELPTGGAIGLRIGGVQVRQSFEPRASAALGTAPIAVEGTSLVAGATVRQPLVRGLGPGVARAARHKADLDAGAGDRQAELEAATFLRELAVAYWELAYAHEELATARESLELAAQQLAQTRAARGAGGVAANALDAVKYQAAVREEAVLRAQLAVEARSLELRLLVGLDVGAGEILIRPADPLVAEARDLDLEDALARGLADNPALAVAQARQRVAELDVGVARDRARPRLDLELTGALVGSGPAAGPAFAALRDATGYEVGATLTLELSIGRAGAAGVRAAELARSQVKVERAALERELTTRIIVAVHQVEAARERATLAARAIDVARDNLAAERALFLGGRTTNFDVLARQAELADARLRRARAVADYHQARATLGLYTGTILDDHGVPVAKG